MDDILFFTETIEEHYNIIDQVLTILEKNKLILQSKKCLFHQIKINYLDIIVFKGSAEVNPTKFIDISSKSLPTQLNYLWR